MERKFSVRRIPKALKWVMGIFGGIALLVLAAALYLAAAWKPMISSRLREAVTKGTDSLYSISFDDMRLNLFTGNVAFTNIIFKPDTAVYRRMREAGLGPGSLYDISLKTLVLERTRPLTAYFKKRLEINAIIFDQPKLVITRYRPQTARKPVAPNRPLYRRLPEALHSVSVGEIVFYHADVTINDNRKARHTANAFKEMAIKVTDLLVDSVSAGDKQRFYGTRDIFVQLKNYRQHTSDGMYTMRFEELSASTQHGYTRLKGFAMTPRLPELAFSRKYKVQHDRYDLRFDEILLKGMDFRLLDSDERLFAPSMTVSGARAKVFLNRELPPPAIDKWVNFPHVVLKKLPLNVRIDTLFIKRSAVTYSEFNPVSGQNGTVAFRAFNGSIRNVTNDSLSLAKNHHAYARVSALLMGKTPMSMQIDFNLADPDAAFSFRGSAANLDLAGLNSLSRPMSMLEIASGYVTRAVYQAHGNRFGTRGTLRLTYRDLKIRLLKKDKEDGHLKKNGILSLLANVALVKNDNPSPGEPLRVAAVKFDRPPYSSFFNVLWKTVFLGIKESIGLGMIPEKAPPGTEKVKENKKQERKEKRAGRRKKRQERRERREKADEKTS
ncbi:DUF748 domain-containing protein [Hufsiella ginkgonis]|uniref:DUF748 domain-containing protein n=1 Tax=Hufsiella ginkgonis TaxID=2695274 RepID=A0A7K1Y2P6_9SPHI|nr:DUF748 domain-containing protein [Hufsiella ginkgonis]MXV17545.1 hypothetical protein [Hufsiella ginkgonis]